MAVHTSADLVQVSELDVRRHAEDLRQTWQGRTLAAVTRRVSNVSGRVVCRDYMGAVILSILSHSFDDAMLMLGHVLYPGFEGFTGSIVCSIGRIDKSGHVIADVLNRGHVYKRAVLFMSEDNFKGRLRKFADRMGFTDQERLEFFSVARRWLAADERLDPTMDRADPDAKRLVVH